MASKITVTFNADTAGFVANVDKASVATQRLRDSADKAKAVVNASYIEQVKAAKQVGASAEELNGIMQRAAQMRGQIEQDLTSKLASIQSGAQDKRLQKFQATAARETAILRASLEEQARLTQAAALRADIQARNPAANVAPALSGIFGVTFDPAAGEEASKLARSVENVGEAAGHSVTGVQASSAAIRALEGGLLTNRRAAEAFISTIGPLAGILETAFPVIGAAALGAALFEMGKKAVSAFNDIVNLTGAIKGLNEAQVAVDKTVAGYGDQTETNIEGILEKTGGHAAALRQKLAYQSQKPLSLDTFFYSDAVKKLPDDLKGNYEDLYKNVAPADVPERLRKITTEVGKLQDALSFNKQGLFGEAQTKVGDFGSDGSRDPVQYMTARLKLAQQIQAQLQGASDAHVSGIQGLQVDVTSQQATDAATAQAKAEAAQRKREEAARRAAEVQRAQLEKQFKDQNAAHPMDADGQRFFWQSVADGKNVLPGNKDFLDEKRDSSSTDAQKQDAEKVKQWRAQYEKDQRTGWDLQHDAFEQAGHRSAQDEATFWALRLAEAEKGSDNYKQAMDKYTAAEKDIRKQQEDADKERLRDAQENYKLDASLAEKRLALAQRQGQVTPAQVASQTADIHSQQFAQTVFGDGGLEDALSSAKRVGTEADVLKAEEEIHKAFAERVLQIETDTANQAAQTWSGALKNSLSAWVQDAQDTSKQLAAVVGQSLNGINSDIADLMVGDKSHFAQTARGIAKTLGNDALKQSEAPLLKSLGFGGKADCSQSSPWYVKLVDSLFGHNSGRAGDLFSTATGTSTAAGGASDVMKGLGSLFDSSKTPPASGTTPANASAFASGLQSAMAGMNLDSGSDDSTGGASQGTQTSAVIPASNTSKTIGGVVRVIGNLVGLFGGGKALGGGVQAGVTYDVGEMGREKFTPTTNGVITPNHALDSGAAYYTVNVGNGVTPEQMNMHMQEALKAVHPKVVRDSVAAVHDHQRRHPGSRH